MAEGHTLFPTKDIAPIVAALRVLCRSEVGEIISAAIQLKKEDDEYREWLSDNARAYERKSTLTGEPL